MVTLTDKWMKLETIILCKFTQTKEKKIEFFSNLWIVIES